MLLLLFIVAIYFDGLLFVNKGDSLAVHIDGAQIEVNFHRLAARCFCACAYQDITSGVCIYDLTFVKVIDPFEKGRFFVHPISRIVDDWLAVCPCEIGFKIEC